MSDMEYQIGKVVEVGLLSSKKDFLLNRIRNSYKVKNLSDESILELAKENYGETIEDKLLNFLFEECDQYDRFIFIGDRCFEVTEVEEIDPDMCIATRNVKGHIDFNLSYYNGGCCFSEALEDAPKELIANEEK